MKPDQDSAERAVEETAAETGVRCLVVRELGGRVHPLSGAWCEYFLAECLTGELVNGQPGENSDVTWAPLPTLTRFIQRDRIFRPVLDLLEKQMSEPLPEPTVAMAIVTSERGVLLARRHDGKPLWTFIGGGIEEGESPSEAAVREVEEETGLSVMAREVLGRRVHPKTGAAMAYVACSAANGLEVHLGDPEDHAEVRWMSWSEAEGLLPHLFEPVADHLRHVLS